MFYTAGGVADGGNGFADVVGGVGGDGGQSRRGFGGVVVANRGFATAEPLCRVGSLDRFVGDLGSSLGRYVGVQCVEFNLQH